jgi:hypothetical protein
MQPTVRTDFNELLLPLLDLAESMLEGPGAFRPFGARLAAGGQLALIDVTPTLQSPSNPLILDALYATFRLEARREPSVPVRCVGMLWSHARKAA